MHTGINRRQVHPLIRFLLRSRVDERIDLHKAIHHLSGSCSGWRYGANSGVPVCSDSLGTLTKRADFLKEQKSRSVRVFLKTPFRPCPLGCGRFLSSVDSHDRCLQCLGIQRAEAAFVDGLCVRSEHITMAALRSRLSLLTGMGGAPSVTTRTGFSAMSREPSASALGDLRVTVRAFRRASPHGPFTPPAAAVLCGSPVILLCRLTACPAFHSARR